MPRKRPQSMSANVPPVEPRAPAPEDAHRALGSALHNCLESIQVLLICAQNRNDGLVSWREEKAEDAYKGQKAPAADEERPWRPIPGLSHWGTQLSALADSHPEVARHWSGLRAWAAVWEVLDLFRAAIEKLGADRHWALYWTEVRPALAKYRFADVELEVMADAIRADLLKARPDSPLHVPVLPQAAPSLPAPVAVAPHQGAAAPSKGLAFLPGAFVYRGHQQPLRGKPLEVLRALHDARAQALTLTDLQNRIWSDSDAGEEAIRCAVVTARKALRQAMKAMQVQGPTDPIPVVDRGTNRTAWRLDLP